MKSKKISFDLSDAPQIPDLLRMRAARKRMSQKAILIEALGRYFSQEQEDEFIKSAANKSCSEWNNHEDEIYDSL